MSGKGSTTKRSRPSTLLGQLVLEARTRLGLTLAELASRTKWTRSYINLLENGHRNAEAPCIIELARALEVDPVTLLHAAYMDRLSEAEQEGMPKGEAPRLQLNYRAARQLQEQQFDYTIGLFRITARIRPDGTLQLLRRFENCRPTRPGARLQELVFQERIVGGEARPYELDTLRILDKPSNLDVHTDSVVSNGWIRHRVCFPSGWEQTDEPSSDRLSFEYARELPGAYARDAREYLQKFRVLTPSQAFVGKGTIYLPHLVGRLQVDWELPESSRADSWRLRIWWGLESTDTQNLQPEGACRSAELKTTTNTAQLTVDRPLAGYSFSIQWLPAELAKHLEEGIGGPK